MILVDAEGLAVRRPDRPLFEGLSVTVSSGDRLGVVGINGTGKTTLLRALAGEVVPDEGQVRTGRGVHIGYLPQEPALPPGTVLAALGGWEGEALAHQLGMAADLSARTDELSGGQAKRVALARLFVMHHELLILDEPTNHLDLDAVEWLEERLARHRGGLVLVTHDRHVLDHVTNRVLELDRGRGYLHAPKGEHQGSGYAAYLEARIEREERAADAEQVRRNLARTELAWLRRGAPARSRKPKARMDAAKALVAARPEDAARQGDLDLSLGSSRLGSKVIELHHVSFAHRGGAMVLRGLDHVIEPGDRLGLVGPNGAGKSTLLDLLAGRLQPVEGDIERGSTVKLAYHDQLGATLDLDQRVRDAVAGPDGVVTPDTIRLMQRFWFDDDAQWARIGTLSGGERRRLQLLLALVGRPNVLLLDEPTNDLDLDTLRALEDFLDDWPGAVVVASHDRTFLDRTVEEVLALPGDGTAALVRGGYAGWRAEHDARRAAEVEAARSAPPDEPAGAGSRPDRARGARSPSTLRRLLGEASRNVATLVERRDVIEASMAAMADHVALAALADDLAVLHLAIDEAEERWFALAEEAEAAGLTVD